MDLTGAQRMGHGRCPIQDHMRGARHERGILVARWLTLRGVDHHHSPAASSRRQLDGKGESGTASSPQVHVAGHLDKSVGSGPGCRAKTVAVSRKAGSVSDPGEQRRARRHLGDQGVVALGRDPEVDVDGGHRVTTAARASMPTRARTATSTAPMQP